MNLPVTKHVQLFHCLPAHSTSVKFQSHSSIQADFINSKRFESLCLSGHSMIFFSIDTGKSQSQYHTRDTLRILYAKGTPVITCEQRTFM